MARRNSKKPGATRHDDLAQRAAALQARGDYPAAVEAYGALATRFPLSAEVQHNLAAALRSASRLDEAEAIFRRALALSPVSSAIRFAVGSAYLSLGLYSEGWPLYEARYDVPGLIQPKPRLPFPEWRGQSVVGKSVAIFPEQGLGDQIQFARFVGDLRDRGATVTLLCHPALVRLFETNLDALVVPAAGQVEFPDPDMWVTSTSLPARLGVTLDTLNGGAYLSWPGRDGARADDLRIGLVWRGSPHHRNDANRSLPKIVGEQLADLSADIVSLDPADSGATDFADTAAIVAGLDLVVTVDTSVAHLAGAMGKPCWVLIPATDTDWRWLRERRDSPWYDSVRLYRQNQPGLWDDVVAEIRRDVVDFRP